jgi:hypothetical protein
MSAPEIAYRLDLPPFAARVIDKLETLSAGVFGSVAPQYISWRMASMPDVSAFLAICDERFVGFKVGYAMSQRPESRSRTDPNPLLQITRIRRP